MSPVARLYLKGYPGGRKGLWDCRTHNGNGSPAEASTFQPQHLHTTTQKNLNTQSEPPKGPLNEAKMTVAPGHGDRAGQRVAAFGCPYQAHR